MAASPRSISPSKTWSASSSRRCCNLLSSAEARPRPPARPALDERRRRSATRAGSWPTQYIEPVIAGAWQRPPSALMPLHRFIAYFLGVHRSSGHTISTLVCLPHLGQYSSSSCSSTNSIEYVVGPAKLPYPHSSHASPSRLACMRCRRDLRLSVFISDTPSLSGRGLDPRAWVGRRLRGC